MADLRRCDIAWPIAAHRKGIVRVGARQGVRHLGHAAGGCLA